MGYAQGEKHPTEIPGGWSWRGFQVGKEELVISLGKKKLVFLFVAICFFTFFSCKIQCINKSEQTLKQRLMRSQASISQTTTWIKKYKIAAPRKCTLEAYPRGSALLLPTSSYFLLLSVPKLKTILTFAVTTCLLLFRVYHRSMYFYTLSVLPVCEFHINRII